MRDDKIAWCSAVTVCHLQDSRISGAAHECILSLASVREVWSSSTIARHTLLPHYLATRLITASDAIPGDTEPALIEDVSVQNTNRWIIRGFVVP